MTTMSDEIPQSLGELSNAALHSAIDKIDAALSDAPQELRDAVSVVRLVVDVPRRGPWYGVPVDPNDSSVTIGTLLGNIVKFHEEKLDRQTASRYRSYYERGKADYYDYLDHIWNPEEWDRQAERDDQRRREADWARRSR
jgi:hypothetical protein